MSEMFRQTLAETAEAAGLEVEADIIEGHVVVPDDEPTTMEIILPTGEMVDLSDPASCARALASVREIESHLKEVRGAIVDAFAAERERRGVDEIELPDGSVVKVKRNYDIHWDAQQLEADLREAGMPEERIREIVVEEVSYSVKAVEANKAAKRNVAYAEAVAKARTEIDKRPSISLPRG